MFSKFSLLIPVILGCLCLRTTLTTAAKTTTTASPAIPKKQKSLVSNKKVVIVGGGPVGLYFAALLLHHDASVQIHILESRPKDDQGINAFGMGAGERMQHRLDDVPGLKEQALAISSPVDGLGIPLVSRSDLTNQMSDFIIQCSSNNNENSSPSSSNCRFSYGTSCEHLDLTRRRLVTTCGQTMDYDLLIAADGVNSKIRKQLVDECHIKEQHYLEDANWKSLTLPKQPANALKAGSFKPFQHESIAGGRVLPKAPEGHILLMFWRGNANDNNNPKGVETVDDLKVMIAEALLLQNKQSIPKNTVSFVRRLLKLEAGDSSIDKSSTIVFDDAACQAFIESRVGRAHHLRVEQYHFSDSVALLGDSAHAFNSMLGQGCATGLESAHTLAEALLSSNTTIGDALSTYTKVATNHAHAMTELSLLNYAVQGGWVTLKAAPLLLWSTICGKNLIKRIRDVNVPFPQIVTENRRLLRLCRREFEKKRMPFVA